MPRNTDHLVTVETISGRVRRWIRTGDYTADLECEDYYTTLWPSFVYSLRPPYAPLPPISVDARIPHPDDLIIRGEIPLTGSGDPETQSSPVGAEGA